MSLRSKLRTIRFFFNLVILLIIGVVIFQNSETSQVDILWWTTEIPLALLLFFVALGGALIGAFIVAWRR